MELTKHWHKDIDDPVTPNAVPTTLGFTINDTDVYKQEKFTE